MIETIGAACVALVVAGCGSNGGDMGTASNAGGATSSNAFGNAGSGVKPSSDAAGDCSDHAAGCPCKSVGETAACTEGGVQTCHLVGEFPEWSGCDCTPATCASLGANCGTVSDGCGSTLDCGSCVPDGGFTNVTCGGGGKPNVCGCTPTTCASVGAECGQLSDGCGGTLDCGTCAAPEGCGGAGVPNKCGGCKTECIPGRSVWCPGTYVDCYVGDFWDYQATQTCQPDGTWGPCQEGGTPTDPGCGDGTSTGDGWFGDCSSARCQ